MKESQEQCFQEEGVSIQLVKKLSINRLLSEVNHKKRLILRDPVCIYHKVQLLKYPQSLDILEEEEIVEVKQCTKFRNPIQIIQNQSLMPLKMQDFYRKMNCVYNRFNQNPLNKYDMTIFLRNIKTMIKAEMFWKYEKCIWKKQNNENSHKLFTFQSNYESGNLLYAFQPKEQQVGYVTYYLMLQNDTNTHGYNQWFNFLLMPNWSKIKRKTIQVRICIVNISKDYIYNNQMSILTNSQGKWEHKTSYLYYPNKFQKYSFGKMMTFDFSYKFESSNHPKGVFFCLTYPYTYTKLLNCLKQLNKMPTDPNYQLTIENIGKSEGENSIFMVKLEFTKIKEKQVSMKKSFHNKKNKAIIIIARQHPVETPGSFIAEHIIKELIKDGPQKQGGYDWFIFPMVNPDGVIHGHSRSNLKGYDINRCWGNSTINLSSQNVCVNKKIQEISSNYQCQYLFDLHGHSKQYGFFCFFAEKNRKNTAINYLFNEKCQFYNISRSRYGITYKKRQTFRGQMYYNYQFRNAITIQTSLYGYQLNGKIQPFSENHFIQIANKLIGIIYEIKIMTSERERNIQFKAKQLQKNTKQNSIKEIKIDLDSDSDPQGEYLQQKQRQMLAQDIKLLETDKLNMKINFVQVVDKKNSRKNTNNIRAFSPIETTQRSQQKRQTRALSSSNFKRSQENFRKKPIYTNSFVEIRQYKQKTQYQQQPKRYSVDNTSQVKKKKKFINSRHFIKTKMSHSYSQSKKINGVVMQTKSGLIYPTECNIKLNISQIPRDNLLSTDSFIQFPTQMKQKINRHLTSAKKLRETNRANNTESRVFKPKNKAKILLVHNHQSNNNVLKQIFRTTKQINYK